MDSHMKKILSLFMTILLLTQAVSFAANTPSGYHSKEPDFSPPKDLSGPVFPPEELISEPTPETNRFLNEFINMMATLGLIVSLILIIAWFLKRMLNSRQEQANATSLIKVIERRSLSPKTAIYLIEIEGKSLVVAESHNGVTRLTDYDSPSEPEEQQQLPSAFSKLLEKPK